MKPINRDERDCLDLYVERPFDGISRFDPILERLMQPADPFTEMNGIAQSLYTWFQLDALANFLTVG
ncbi:hypothetical protein SH501x_000518 [Pirellulaceae bacterium SH501]